MNTLNITGRLTKDVKYSDNGDNPVAAMTVAVPRNFKNNEGKYDADFINVKAFKKIATNCSQFIKKGSRISVTGPLRTRTYQGNNNQTVFVTEVYADSIDFLDPPEKNNNHEQNHSNNQNRSNYHHGDNDYNSNISDNDVPPWMR